MQVAIANKCRSSRTVTAKTIVNAISARVTPQAVPAPIPELGRPQVASGTSQTSESRGTTIASGIAASA